MLPKMVTKVVTCYQKWEQNGNMLKCFQKSKILSKMVPNW